jgi:hypothetical protein
VDVIMSEPLAEDGWTPRPELLAAYADGELPAEGPQAALHERIEAWLAKNPEVACDVETYRQVTERYRATAADDPGPAAWAPVLARLRALRLTPGPSRRRWSRLGWLGAGGGMCAAAWWLALTLWSHPVPQKASPDVPLASESSRVVVSEDTEPEVFPVATAAEIEILSVRGEDTGSVVIGELPVEGSLVLLEPSEVTLTHAEPARDNMVPEVRRCGRAACIWAPLDAEREDPEEGNWD